MAIRVLPGPRFAERTTLRLGGRARAEVSLAAPEDADGLVEALASRDARAFVLGWGSNLLAADHDLDLAVVSLEPGQPRLADEPACCGAESGPDAVRVLAPGGMMLPRLVSWCAANGLSGLEPLAGIPGTVGGAVAMNAGSYGRETASLLTRLLVWDSVDGTRWIGPAQWRAGYRHFEILSAASRAEVTHEAGNVQGLADQFRKELGLEAQAPAGRQQASGERTWLALEAELTLRKADPKAVRAAVDQTLARKKASQPVSAATCGCVFKNPEGASAGKLLDELGFKGRSLGGMRFSPMHANFLVNEGGGTAHAALELIEQARQAVRAARGLELELEVRVLQ